MNEDPFEKFKKKKQDENLPPSIVVDDSFYEIPIDSSTGQVKGMVSHRFKSSETPRSSKPKGFTPTSLTEE